MRKLIYTCLMLCFGALLSNALSAQCNTELIVERVICDNAMNSYSVQVSVVGDTTSDITWTAPLYGFNEPQTFGSFIFGPFETEVVEFFIIVDGESPNCPNPFAVVTPDCDFGSSCDLAVDVLDVTCSNAGNLGASLLMQVNSSEFTPNFTYTAFIGGVSYNGLTFNTPQLIELFNLEDGTYNIFVVADSDSTCTQTGTFALNCGINCPLQIGVADTTWASCGSANGSITFSVGGFEGDYQITYTDATGNTGSVTNSNVIDGLPSGCYEFELSDMTDFCSAFVSYCIPERSDLSVSIDGNASGCSSVVYTANVTGGAPPYTYVWNNGETTPTVVLTDFFGEISVTVTDINGCFATQTVDVNFFPLQLLPDSLGVVRNAICGTPTGQIITEVWGGTPPYAYEWSTGATGSSIGELLAGEYSLTVTDSEGCSIESSYTVAEDELPFDLLIGNGNGQFNPQIVTQCDGGGVIDARILVGQNIPDYTDSYTITVNGVAEVVPEPFFEIDELGDYTVEVMVEFTSGETCSATRSFTVVAQGDASDAFTIELRRDTFTNTGQGCGATLIAADAAGNVLFVDWELPNGGTISGFSVNADLVGPGVYIASLATPGFNCPLRDTFLVLAEDLTCVTVQGYVFLDNNGDCTQGSFEGPIPNQLVSLTSADDADEVYFAYTGADGTWTASVPAGDYLANAISPNPLFTPCADQVVTATTEGGNSFTGIPLIPEGSCPQVTIDLNIPRIRRCFDSPVYLNYENRGTAVSENTVVTLEFGEWVDEVLPFFEPEPDAIGINPTTGLLTATWNIGDVAPFERGNLNVLAYTCSADFPITTAACVTATVEPNNPCPPADENWTGASVNVSGTCQQDSVVFTLQNVGDANMSIELQYIVVEDGVIITPDPEVSSPLEAGASKEVVLPANGSTYHVQVTQEPLHPGLTMPIDFVEGCGQGNTSTGFALQFPVSDDAYWIDEDCVPIIGSYDPNDKLAEPKGYAAQNYIVADQPIDYQIRFQNTGNDTAFLVVIRDTISELLDLTTFELLSTTHDVKVEFDTMRGLAFIFENLMLPDSFVNEPASNGSVSFRIHPVADLGPGTEIENTASIYFDFNEAIVTNTYLHTVEEDFVAVSVFDFSPTVERLNVVPNPTAGPAYIELPPALTGEKLELQIVDALGRVVQQYQYGDGERPEADLSRLPAGWYSLRLTSATQLVGSGRLLLQR
ncbi:MAG: T9SS type A sorting domain-containing protein [Bacteroidota bacterium]